MYRALTPLNRLPQLNARGPSQHHEAGSPGALRPTPLVSGSAVLPLNGDHAVFLGNLTHAHSILTWAHTHNTRHLVDLKLLEKPRIQGRVRPPTRDWGDAVTIVVRPLILSILHTRINRV